MKSNTEKRLNILAQCLAVAPQIDKEMLKKYEKEGKTHVDIPFEIPAAKNTHFRWSFKMGTIIAVFYDKKIFGEVKRVRIDLFK